ncbi:sulfotransferase domain-containing protein [Nocardioides panacisoli]|uniref:sulfotransferase domain-containing protein n=1 Tax=Nocardioides panacisoli TaxID=627624 RepID=UPI001C63A658|nr:sulfotransferase domain-containing protein [Nocardioides panacisoli]QYJ03735.1 sulfotransferase domain-containing protein [Nocardioides panacisoli]
MFADLNDTRRLDRQLSRLDSMAYVDRDVAAFINNPQSMLLLTIPKCGTTWLRYLLINYSLQVADPGADRADYAALSRYSVERSFIRRGTNPVPETMGDLRPGLGVDYLLVQHLQRGRAMGGRLMVDVMEHGGPKLCASRNVLDFLVSCYYYFFEYRDANRGKASHPRDLIDVYVRYWALNHRYLTERVIPGGGAAMVDYDDLMRDTAGTLAVALDAIDVVPDTDALTRAVERSTAENAAEDEQQQGRTLEADLDRGSFVRSGAVGQWREYFDDDDVAAVERVLSDSGVDPEVTIGPLR